MTVSHPTVSRAVSRLRFNVRGENGEGSAISSATIQISTGGTLGLSEAQAISGLRHVVDEVVRQETLALTEEEAERLSAAPSGRPSGKKEKAPDVLVMTEGFPLGFARRSGLILKNRRNPAWRILS